MSKNHCSSDDLPEQVEIPKDPRFVDRAGQTHGRLTVLYYVGKRPGGKSRKGMWLCVCECGQHVVVTWADIQQGKTLSCGCLGREILAACRYKHGLCRSSEYYRWHCMIARCTNPLAPSYARYGGRGIRVCDRWKNSIQAFIEDMGQPPTPAHSIDRIDNDGNYEPGNCRWATPVQQQRNMRSNRLLTAWGETRCVSDWANRLAMPVGTLFNRLNSGWSVERALSEPIRSEKYSKQRG